MRVVRSVTDLRRTLDHARNEGRTIGFVPTMGALHRGHLSLVAAARRDNDVVVLSIFVNPLQFGPDEDLAAYPRDEAGDLVAAEAAGVDVAFLPTKEEMYPRGGEAMVRVGELGTIVEGASRPGHFDGVATVVAKLLNMVGPHRLYLGQKDAQQVAVIKTMVGDLSYGVDVVVCPTVREPDGLALSSRNAYLGARDRERATVLWRALQTGKTVAESGGAADVVEKAMKTVIEQEEGVALDYARAVDPERFGPPGDSGPILLLIAAQVGPARLIDNLLVVR
jgi:pantoate--beta-alanine ligase